jgi:hypothetical protein
MPSLKFSLAREMIQKSYEQKGAYGSGPNDTLTPEARSVSGCKVADIRVLLAACYDIEAQCFAHNCATLGLFRSYSLQLQKDGGPRIL